MIELCYHCPDCHTYLSGWYSAEEGIEQPEECLFCGSEHAFVYLSNIETEDTRVEGEFDHLLLCAQQALDQDRELSEMFWEDPAYFDS